MGGEQEIETAKAMRTYKPRKGKEVGKLAAKKGMESAHRFLLQERDSIDHDLARIDELLISRCGFTREQLDQHKTLSVETRHDGTSKSVVSAL